MQQLELCFESGSPINKDKFCNQNKLVYEHMESGATISTLIAEQLYGIRNLHSRISDLRNKHGVVIYGRTIEVADRRGIKVKCKEYSLKRFY